MADREAFDAYVRERWAPLLRTATRKVGDPQSVGCRGALPGDDRHHERHGGQRDEEAVAPPPRRRHPP